MTIFPDTEKKLRAKIPSYKSALNKEKRTHGFINDGAGKRYLIFWLLFVLNDLKKSAEYFEWYKQEFSDDAGEPIQLFCRAVSLFRMKRHDDASYALAESMISNLYLIPYVLGTPVDRYDIWHPSNEQEPDYVFEMPEEIILALTKEDIEWLHERYDSFSFRRIRILHMDIYRELLKADDINVRMKLLEKSKQIFDPLKTKGNKNGHSENSL